MLEKLLLAGKTRHRNSDQRPGQGEGSVRPLREVRQRRKTEGRIPKREAGQGHVAAGMRLGVRDVTRRRVLRSIVRLCRYAVFLPVDKIRYQP